MSKYLDLTGLTYLWSKIKSAIALKQDKLTFDSTPTANSSNPVTSSGIKAYVDGVAGSGTGNLTKESVGLGNVDNTSDADKPVSTAQQTALDLKLDKSAVKTATGTSTTDVMSQKTVTDLLAAKQATLTFDTAPKSASTNPVTSGGVYTALAAKQDTMTAITNAEIDTLAV